MHRHDVDYRTHDDTGNRNRNYDSNNNNNKVPRPGDGGQTQSSSSRNLNNQSIRRSIVAPIPAVSFNDNAGIFYNDFDGGDDDNLSRRSYNTATMNLHKTTRLQSFLHLLKGYVGPGCLSLPWAVSQLGITSGVIATFVMAYWSSYNCWTVVRFKRICQNSNHYGPLPLTYPDLAGWLYGPRFQRFTTTCICIQQLAICTVFLSFVGANLSAVLVAVWSVPLTHVQVISCCLPAVLALSFLPNLKALAPATATGAAFLGLALLCLSTVIGLQWNDRPRHEALSVDWTSVPLAFCAILYSYEGICLVLPVESSMQRPEHFQSTFVTAMIASAVVFALVASFCVAAFGPVTNGSVTAFLLEKYADRRHLQGLLLAANGFVSLSVLVTYPLQLFPALELVGPWFRPWERWVQSWGSSTTTSTSTNIQTNFTSLTNTDESASDSHNQYSADDVHDERMEPLDISPVSSVAPSALVEVAPEASHSPVARISLVMLTYVVAVAVPNVQILISLAGALAGSSTALLIPPALELAYLKQYGTESDTMSIGMVSLRVYILLALGLIFMGIGTGASLLDIYRVYTQSGEETGSDSASSV
jgi:proton-coupled amino acid transporter